MSSFVQFGFPICKERRFYADLDRDFWPVECDLWLEFNFVFSSCNQSMHIKTRDTIAFSHLEFMHYQRQFSSELPFKNSCLKSSSSLQTSLLNLCTAGLMKYFLVCRISQQIFDTFGLPTRQCWTVTQLVNDSLGHFLFVSLKVLRNKQSKRQESKQNLAGFFTLLISSSV